MADKRKLYPIVGGGFSTNIKKALISFIYPTDVETEIVETSISELVNGLLLDAIIFSEDENTILNIPSIVSGELKELLIQLVLTELVQTSQPTIVSGFLKDALFYTSENEIVIGSIPSIVSGNILNPIFYTEPNENVETNIPTLVSGSLI